MRVYFDTSAIIPLVLAEPHSEAMRSSWPEFTERWAWSWLVIEAEAALVRQNADADAWAEWSRVARSLNLIELNPRDHGALRAFNRGLGLRAADAGHLFLFDRLARELDGLQLVTLDREMSEAAENLAMATHAF
ncbi:MAG TPA: type II toxin-antitoxin system VapC family toxin [Opitutales bacterium]|nr:type II toxin-antitoxin system VapC family toxin [Opitutales bacterium]